jgi:hypothetical protein
MSTIGGVFGDIVDDDGFVVLPDLVAKGGFDHQFSAGYQAERDFVARCAANPALLGDARHGGETHAGRSADYFKNARDCRNTLHGSDIRAEVGRHDQLSLRGVANASAGLTTCREIRHEELKQDPQLVGTSLEARRIGLSASRDPVARGPVANDPAAKILRHRSWK